MNIKSISNLLLGELSAYNNGYSEDIKHTNDGYLHDFSKNEKTVKIIFDQVNFKVLSISENIEALSGYKPEKLLKENAFFFLNHIAFEHLPQPYVWLQWANKLHYQYGISEIDQYSIAIFCGVKFKHRDGHIVRVMLRQTGIEYLENGAMKISIISADDVTHLLKGDFYWGRIIFGKDVKYIHHLSSTDGKDMAQDIISDREKDTLRLLAKGMESKEIGKELFISSHTVDNHRRNMIARTGARDTTALLQLCHMSGII
jgi:DNA-binding CsgD family transcriptional regulator